MTHIPRDTLWYFCSWGCENSGSLGPAGMAAKSVLRSTAYDDGMVVAEEDEVSFLTRTRCSVINDISFRNILGLLLIV